MELTIATPRWALPLLQPARYKVAFGGRGGGKSHFFAELLVERMMLDSDLRVVCIREVQKSLRFSVKSLIEQKIEGLGVAACFDILSNEIRRKDGEGICIFQGLQEYTADSVKSLENFMVAWCEEAQNLSDRSLSLLRPTIRASGSEIWFSYNPEQPTDPVDKLFRGEDGSPKGSIVVPCNYYDNPYLSEVALAEMELDRARDTDYYNHVWLGGYNIKSQLQVLGGKWRLDEFEPGSDWSEVFYGADWGFAADPTVATRSWVHDRCLWVEYESWEIGLELDETAARWIRDVPGIAQHTVRADNARPESISHVRRAEGKRPGIPGLVAADKWAGSVEDGIAYLRNFDQIVIHQRCQKTIEEARLYSYKTNAAGDILPAIVDKFNHCADSLRYAHAPLIKRTLGSTQARPTKPATNSPASIRKIF